MTVLGTHRTSTHGVATGHRPSATLAAGITKKLRLDLGREVLLIALGDSPMQSLQALRDDLDAILGSEKA